MLTRWIAHFSKVDETPVRFAITTVRFRFFVNFGKVDETPIRFAIIAVRFRFFVNFSKVDEIPVRHTITAVLWKSYYRMITIFRWISSQVPITRSTYTPAG
jgi:hypothetical protein